MILILLHIDCPIKWTLNFYWFNADKKDWKTKMAYTLCISSTWPPNSSKALSLDTLFDIAIAHRKNSWPLRTHSSCIIAHLADGSGRSYPFSYFYICESTVLFCAVPFFVLYLDILVLLWYCVLLQGGETHERNPETTV